MAERAARQQYAVLEEHPPGHGIAGIHVLGHRMFHKAGRRDQRDFAAAHVGLLHHAANTAEVVAMGVGNHYGHHRTLTELLVDKVQRRLGGFLGGQHVKDDPAGVALDKADVGQVIAAHLINLARHHFIQAVGHVEHGLALQ